MKRVAKAGLLVSFLFALGGCPIWNGGDGSCDNDCNPYGQCNSNFDCSTDAYCGADGFCHPYDPSTTSGQPTTTSGGSTSSGTGGAAPVYCGNPKDCGAGETCSPDGTCQPGDCTQIGCIYGYTCDSSASPPACKPQNPAACGSDSECADAGSGYKCVNGVCTAPSDQCFDKTQCASGDVCADGKCVPSCANNTTCPTEYTCSDVQTCTEPATPCTITNDCGGPTTVCVDGACVPRSPGGVCPSGHVWVENGCIPDQHATFVCSADGQQDACKTGSICLHHSCYISCESPNQNACSALPSFNQCKPVTTQSGDHQVCGSSNNLGSECNPTAGQNCASGKICIDGFCK